ncbi:MAG: hypothetical protein V1810_00010 [Candidatus Beckwithbacteria bacterium]
MNEISGPGNTIIVVGESGQEYPSTVGSNIEEGEADKIEPNSSTNTLSVGE